MKKAKFNLNDKLLIVLKEQGYFDPLDERREVPILSKSEMEKWLLGNKADMWTKVYKTKRLEGILKIKSFFGAYIEESPTVIKVTPYYGLEHPKSEYFIVAKKQIEKISRYLPEEEEDQIC